METPFFFHIFFRIILRYSMIEARTVEFENSRRTAGKLMYLTPTTSIRLSRTSSDAEREKIEFLGRERRSVFGPVPFRKEKHSQLLFAVKPVAFGDTPPPASAKSSGIKFCGTRFSLRGRGSTPPSRKPQRTHGQTDDRAHAKIQSR